MALDTVSLSRYRLDRAKEDLTAAISNHKEYLNKKLEIQTGSGSGTEMTDAKSDQKQDTTESNS